MNIDFQSTIFKNPNPFVEAKFAVVPDIPSAKLESLYVAFLNNNKISDIRINTKKGSITNAFNWLRKLEYIKSLSFDGDDLESFTEVVKDLHLDELFIDKKIVDPTVLTNLVGTKSIAFSKINTIENLDFSMLKNLESIYLSGYLGSCITFPTCIKSIRVFRSKLKNLDSLINLDCAETIVLQENYEMEDVAAFRKCKNLRKLVIENSKKICTLGELSLKNLEVLSLLGCGKVESIKFLKNSPKIKFVSFPGTDIIDGDLSSLDIVADINFRNMKHYNRKLASGKLLSKGGGGEF